MAFAPLPRPTFGKAIATGTAVGTPAKTKGVARRMHEARLAADLLPVIPPPGEAVHCLMGGNFDLGQVVCALVRNHPVEHLRIATLAYSKKTAAEALTAVEKGHVGRLSLLVSSFFATHNKELFEWVNAEIAAHFPGSRQAAARSHCKVVVFEFRDGACPLVFEGSANLRKNGCREQLAAIRDQELADWHARWIDDTVTAHERA